MKETILIKTFKKTKLSSTCNNNNKKPISLELERSRRRTKRPKRTLVSTLKKRLSNYTPVRSASVHMVPFSFN